MSEVKGMDGWMDGWTDGWLVGRFLRHLLIFSVLKN
jgi:hypothetical protein